MIGPRLADLWQRSEEEEEAPGVIAGRIVEERLALGRRANGESIRRTRFEDDPAAVGR